MEVVIFPHFRLCTISVLCIADVSGVHGYADQLDGCICMVHALYI